MFLSSSVGSEHHVRCRLLLYLGFGVNDRLKVKGHLACFGTVGNARANSYSWNHIRVLSGIHGMDLLNTKIKGVNLKHDSGKD